MSKPGAHQGYTLRCLCRRAGGDAWTVLPGATTALAPPFPSLALPPPVSIRAVPLVQLVTGDEFVCVCWRMPGSTASALAAAAGEDLSVATTVTILASVFIGYAALYACVM